MHDHALHGERGRGLLDAALAEIGSPLEAGTFGCVDEALLVDLLT